MVNKAKKILLFTHSFPNSKYPLDSQFLGRQIQALAGMGVEVLVVTVGYGQEEETRTSESGFELVRFPVRSMRYEEQRGFADHARYLLEVGYKGRKSLKKEMQAFEPDLLVFEGFIPGGIIALALKKMLRRMKVRTIVRASGSEYRVPRKIPLSRLLYRKIFRVFDKVYFVTPDLLESGLADGVPRTKAFFGPRGISAEQFYQDEQLRSRFRAEENREGQFLLLNAARCVPVKMQQTIIRALALVSDKLPEVRLILAGEGPLRPQLEVLAEELGVADKVTFAGALDEQKLLSFLNGADLYIGPHKGSWFASNATLEAALCGCPCIVNACESYLAQYDVKDGQDLLVFEEGDADALAACIEKLHADTALRSRMGEHFKNAVAASFLMKDRLVEYFELDEIGEGV